MKLSTPEKNTMKTSSSKPLSYVPTPKRAKKSIKLDRVNPDDLINKNLLFACEHCSHFDPASESCTIGYRANLHRYDVQMQRFNSHGHMAFCRFLEID